ncbi:MAG: TolC family protein, partial [Candidatus Acidiferrum sp.]
MLRVTSEKKRGRLVLNIEGRLAGESVAALEECWRELQAGTPSKKFQLHLCDVSYIDAAGKALLKEIHRQGAQLVAEGCLNQAIVQEINGKASDEECGSRTKRRKGSSIIFYVALFSLVLGAGRAEAQGMKDGKLPAQEPSQVLRLTLDQAVGLALKQNPTAQIAVLTAAQSVQDKNIARAALLPEANLSVKDEAERNNIQAQFGGRKIPGFPQHVGPYQIFSAGPTFDAPIFDLTLWRRYQAARNTANASKATSLSTREQVILLVVSQYIGTLRAVANVQASQSRVDLAQALYDQAADLQKEGVGTGIDTLRANVELQNEKQRQIEAQNDRETSLYELSKLLNLDPRQPVELADTLSFFETPQPDVQNSIDQALGARQEWKSLAGQMQAAELEKKASRDSR